MTYRLIVLLVFIASAALASEEEARAHFVARADDALDAGPFSVMQKTEIAPSGDKHDYFSLSPFHWPDPDTPDGLPYQYRDGRKNPEVEGDGYDRHRYHQMVDAVEALGYGYRLTEEQRYADHAALLLRTWFLNPETRMNPNLQYAEHAKGVARQQPWGIIRGRQFLDLDRTVQWIEPSEAWTDEDTKAWKAWLSDYLDWLLTSEMGKKEARAWNNHGTWYDVQAAYIALRTGRDAVAREILAAVGEKRIAKHLLPDGRQTKELIRTKSWDYSVMNLEGLFTLARLAEPLDIGLWHFETEDGRQLRDALDYLAQYVSEEKDWPHKQIVPFQPERLYPLLVQGAEVYGDEYKAVAAGINPGAVEHLRVELQEDFWQAIK